VADGVDAAVDAVEPAGCDAVVDRAVTETEPLQLDEGDGSMLPSGKLGDCSVNGGVARFARYFAITGHTLDRGGPSVRCGAPFVAKPRRKRLRP
jgi:hypothetical protein